MKVLIFAVITMLLLTAVGCRARRIYMPERHEATPAATERQPQEARVSDMEPVPTRAERFTFVEPADIATHDANQFFVILGSFSVLENANRFVETLQMKGFDPVILRSEAGMHRVSIDSFREENTARIRVNRIRMNYPEYTDAWLLIRTH